MCYAVCRQPSFTFPQMPSLQCSLRFKRGNQRELSTRSMNIPQHPNGSPRGGTDRNAGGSKQSDSNRSPLRIHPSVIPSQVAKHRCEYPQAVGDSIVNGSVAAEVPLSHFRCESSCHHRCTDDSDANHKPCSKRSEGPKILYQPECAQRQGCEQRRMHQVAQRRCRTSRKWNRNEQRNHDQNKQYRRDQNDSRTRSSSSYRIQGQKRVGSRRLFVSPGL